MNLRPRRRFLLLIGLFAIGSVIQAIVDPRPLNIFVAVVLPVWLLMFSRMRLRVDREIEIVVPWRAVRFRRQPL